MSHILRNINPSEPFSIEVVFVFLFLFFVVFILFIWCEPADHRINLKESEKKDKYLDLARELKKAEKHESNDCANCDWCVRHNN